jgi:hypothetical protein
MPTPAHGRGAPAVRWRLPGAAGPKLSDRPGAAVDLVERARSFNVAVVLIAQAWASLGPDDTIRNRLAGTVGTVLAHQLKQPSNVAARAGTESILSGPSRPIPSTTPASAANEPETATSSTPTRSAASTKAKPSSSTAAKPSSSASGRRVRAR